MAIAPIFLQPKTQDLLGYFWNEAAQRYQADNGRFISQKAVQDGLRVVFDKVAQGMTQANIGLVSGNMSLVEWETVMAQTITDLHVTAAMIYAGGYGQLQAADAAFVEGVVSRELDLLDAFAASVAAGEQQLNGQFVQRVDMYKNSAATKQAARRVDNAQTAGMVAYRNVLGPAEHCDGCLAATDAGWVAIGALPDIGTRQCLSNCKCHFDFSPDPNIIGAKNNVSTLQIGGVVLTPEAVQGTADNAPSAALSSAPSRAAAVPTVAAPKWNATTQEWESDVPGEVVGGAVVQKPVDNPRGDAALTRAVTVFATTNTNLTDLQQRGTTLENRLDALHAQRDEYVNQLDAQGKVISSADDPKLKAINTSILDTYDESKANAQAILQAKARVSRDMQDAVFGKNKPLGGPFSVRWDNFPGKGLRTVPEVGLRTAVMDRIKTAKKFVGQFTGQPDELKGKKLDVIIDDSQDRAFYIPSKYDSRGIGTVVINTNSPETTIVHEMGHWLEDMYGSPVQNARAIFMNDRTAGESARKLSDIFPGAGYADNETAKADAFPHAYIGKIYPGGVTAPTSEVYSMALQMFHDDPYTLMQKDPGLFELLVRQMAR